MTRKLALITGASRGLGKNTALHLAAQGIDIIGTYNSKADEAQALVKTLEASGVRAAMLQLDVGNSASFEAFAQQLSETLHKVFGRQHLDFLVNNAGIVSTRRSVKPAKRSSSSCSISSSRARSS